MGGVGPFLSGLGAAFALFLAFFRLELGTLPVRLGAALCLATTFAGAGSGVALGTVVRRRPAAERPAWMGALAVAAVALWCWWAVGQRLGLLEPYGTLAVALVGFALLAGLNAASGQGQRSVVGLAGGMAFGNALCSAGVMGLLGLRTAVATAVALAAMGALAARPESDVAKPVPAADSLPTVGSALYWTSAVLLAVAVGAAGVGLLRAYEPGVRSLAYGMSDLGAACFGGAFACLWGRKGRGVRPVGIVLGAVGCALVSLLCGFSFVGYPDLVVSESAALQTPSLLLVAGRTFPVWLMAFCLGLCAAPAWAGAVPLSGGLDALAGFLLVAGGAGAAAEALTVNSYAAAHVLPVAVAMLAIGAAWAHGRRLGVAGVRALGLGGLLVGAVGTVWGVCCDPHFGWAGLRRTAQQHIAEARGDARTEGLAQVMARLDGNGLAASFSAGATRGEFVNGNLVYATRPDGAADTPVTLVIALALAFADSPRRVAVVGPESGVVLHEAERLAEGAPVVLIAPHGQDGGTGRFDAVICGPGPMSAPGTPLRVLSREALAGVRNRLSPGGALSLWFPAGRVEPQALSKALATLRDVFPRFYVFLSGEEAVFVATERDAVLWAALQHLQRHLVEAGFWTPAELLVPFVGQGGDLAPLMAGAVPYRMSHPSRPVALARDVTGRGRLISMAALLQYRLRSPVAGGLQWVAFRSEAQRLLEVRSFAGLHAEQTRQALRAAVRAPGGQDELVAFLNGRLVQWKLFGPTGEGRPVSMAGALWAFGMPGDGAKVLRDAIASGHGTPAVHLRLAQLLEGLNEVSEALRHCREALRLQPDLAEAHDRMVGLLVSMSACAEAASALRDVLAKEPDNVGALLRLARLYAGPELNRRREAAELAARALAMEPGNQEAQDILMLCAPSAEVGATRLDRAQNERK